MKVKFQTLFRIFLGFLTLAWFGIGIFHPNVIDLYYLAASIILVSFTICPFEYQSKPPHA